MKNLLNGKACTVTKDVKKDNKRKTPLIDIFINPEKAEMKKKIVQTQQNRSFEYFKDVNMTNLFPELFNLLWYSSLPCTKLPGLTQEFLLKSCHLAGESVVCSDYFTKVPTDIGMCCAVNVQQTFKESGFTNLVEKMQNSSEYSNKETFEKKRIPAAVGIRNGLKLVLDLNSNFESFGSVIDDFRAFRIYIGQPTEFSALEERSLLIEPGREHFIDLSSQEFYSSGCSVCDLFDL